MTKKPLLIFAILLLPLFFYSQNINGRLINKFDKQPVAFAVLFVEETGEWTTSNTDGSFEFKNIQIQSFTIIVKHLGFQDMYYNIELGDTDNKYVEIYAEPNSYNVGEVMVISQKGLQMSTSEVIGQSAIEYVQPNTIGDVMQLLPGNIIDNPNLIRKQPVSIRESGTDINSWAGTAVIIDGAPVSNDANMQVFSTIGISTDFNSINKKIAGTAGEGVDMRQISANNIESVEVIKGIPSVEYGNLTSGAVVIKTKTGYTPFEIKLKTDPNIKNIYAGKGHLFNNGSSINVGADYTRSFEDIRSKYKGFDRITAMLSYAHVFFKNTTPLSVNTGVSLYSVLDSKNTDPDEHIANEYIYNKELGLSYNIQSKLLLNKPMITGIRSNASLSLNKQEYFAKEYRSSGVEKISLSFTEGENEGIYLPAESITELKVKGLPVNVFANIIANKHIDINTKIFNNILFGAEYKLSGNYGEGQLFDVANPPYISLTSSRPRSFKEIPPVSYLSLLFEDKYVQTIGQTKLMLQAGVRFNNFQPIGLLKTELGFYTEPRFNAQYIILNSDNLFINNIALRVGLGLTYKSPAAMYLYPNVAYTDLVSLDYYTGYQNTSLAYFTTVTHETKNNALKPAKNLKREAGVDFNIGSMSASVTGFYESLTDGFGMLNEYRFEHFKVYNATGVPQGEKPNVSNLLYTDSVYIIDYSYPVNNKQTEKYGVEYSFDFGRINKLQTRVIMSGAWLRSERVNSTMNYNYLPVKSGGGSFTEVGVYPAGEKKVEERLNTTFRFVTHSTRLRLILTTTMQVIWYDKFCFEYYNESPLYLYSNTSNYMPFTTEMQNDSYYKDYIVKRGSRYYDIEIKPPLFLFNIKLSKEIYDRLKLSFYANNFINYRPVYRSERALTYERRNPEVYFGAELLIKL